MKVTEVTEFDATTKFKNSGKLIQTEIKAAIIDLYNNEENLGIGAITNC